MSFLKVPNMILRFWKALYYNLFRVDSKEKKLSGISWKKVMATKNDVILDSGAILFNRALLYKRKLYFFGRQWCVLGRFIKPINEEYNTLFFIKHLYIMVIINFITYSHAPKFGLSKTSKHLTFYQSLQVLGATILTSQQ